MSSSSSASRGSSTSPSNNSSKQASSSDSYTLSDHSSLRSLAQKGTQKEKELVPLSYCHEIRNVAFLFFVPLASVCIFNSIPLNDPYYDYKSFGEMISRNVGFIFAYNPACYIYGSLAFLNWFAYFCSIEFTLLELFVYVTVYMLISVASFVVWAYLWVFPLPGATVLPLPVPVVLFLVFIVNVVHNKMLANGDTNTGPRLKACVVATCIYSVDVLLALFVYNGMMYTTDNPLSQVGVTVGYAIAAAALNAAMEQYIRRTAGESKSTFYHFAHYTVSVWSKTFIVSEVSSVGVLLTVVAIDTLMIAKGVWSFSVEYDRWTEWLADALCCCIPHHFRANNNNNNNSSNITSTTTSESSEDSEYSESSSLTRSYSEGEIREHLADGIRVSRAAMLDLYNSLDRDGNGELDAGELKVLGKHIGRSVKDMLAYDRNAKGSLTRDEFIVFMLDDVADKKMDQYIAQQWASVIAPLYYLCVFSVMAFGPNAGYYHTSLECDEGMSKGECAEHKSGLYARSMVFAVILFGSRMALNTVAGWVLYYRFNMNVLSMGLSRMTVMLSRHMWEGIFATTVMIKYLLYHANADISNMTTGLAPWSPFYKGD